MSGTTRYILRQLIGPTLFVTASLAAMVWLTQSLRLLDLIINRGLSVGAFLTMTTLLLPSFLALILPTALFCTIIFVYHRLDADRELVVMRAVGLSPWALAKPALLVALAVTLVGYALTLYFMPAGIRAFKDQQFTVRSDYGSVLLREGTFNTLIDGVTVYVRERERGGELRGILVHDNRDERRPVTVMAERGVLIGTEEGPRFVMFSGNRQEVGPNQNDVSLLYFDKYSLDLGHFGTAVRDRWREPGERFLHELFFPGTSVDDRNNVNKFRAEAHRRLAAPLLALTFAMVGLASILVGGFNRRTAWRGIVVAASVAIAVQVLGLGLTAEAGKDPSLVPLIYGNVLLPIAASIYVMAFPPWWRSRSAVAPGAEAR